MNYDFLWDIGDIVLRSILSILFLFIFTRLMGKKQISQLTFFDYIIGISLGSIAATMAASTDVPYTHTLTAMAVYTTISLTISIITNKSIMARRFFTGKTFLLIDKGKILEANLNKVKYDVNDLLAQARNAGYFNIADIYYALLEINGKISFMPVSDKQPTTIGDFDIVKAQDRLTADVIIDGVVMINNLKSIGLNEEWLNKNLLNNKADAKQDIILATVDTDNHLNVYFKTRKVISTTSID